MRKFLLFIVLVAVSCQKSGPITIAKLDGYWEIEQVLGPDKLKKEYKINETFDHFAVDGQKGFRSKVQPQFDGTFLTNNQPEQFTITTSDGKTFLNYVTPYASWKEEIVSLEDSTLVVKNAQNLEFHYKKTGPLNFTGNGKTTK